MALFEKFNAHNIQDASSVKISHQWTAPVVSSSGPGEPRPAPPCPRYSLGPAQAWAGLLSQVWDANSLPDCSDFPHLLLVTQSPVLPSHWLHIPAMKTLPCIVAGQLSTVWLENVKQK